MFVRGFSLFGNPQVFLGFGKVRMETQRLFKLQDGLGDVPFAHENLTQVVVWLSKFRVEIGSLLKMVFRFG